MTAQYNNLSPVEDALDVLFVLADSLTEVSVADLESQLGFEHLGCVIHIHVGPGHVLQRVVCDGEALCQVQAKRLPPIGEDVKCNLDKINIFCEILEKFTSDLSLCMLVMNFSNKVAAYTLAPILSTSL